MAAGYVASMMEFTGLKPFGNDHSWFQRFQVVRYSIGSASLTLVRENQDGTDWLRGVDFTVDTLPFAGEAEAGVVFAGYGIECKDNGYNDYRDMDVRKCIVVIFEGYPGHPDTTTAPGKIFMEEYGDRSDAMEKKIALARSKGALAVIVAAPVETVGIAVERKDTTGQAEPVYTDDGYYLPGGTSALSIPCLRLGRDASRMLLGSLPVSPAVFQEKAARELTSSAGALPGTRIRFSVALKKEHLPVSNVLGLLPGRDTSRFVLIGAHYDHLGMRNNLTYNGADDNASGVSGMMALAQAWAACPERPSCNLIFAAWTAEEKGVLGSEYFALNSTLMQGKLSLVVNLDMISRSAPEDSSRRVVSIGTLPADSNLRDMAGRSNARLAKPFTLDLWDVTGHCGSDYCHFASRGIPVITFFSGFHDDYHSPRDIFPGTDPEKMEGILTIVNDCLREGTRISLRKPGQH